MLDEFRRSISSILYERTTSPLYGTFIVTWLIWNWKIPYITFFVNGYEIKGTKIDHIVKNYINIYDGLLFPIASTLFLIFCVTPISNWIFAWHVRMMQKRIKSKQKAEENQLLSTGQSIAIRREIARQKTVYEETVAEKNDEIEALKEQIGTGFSDEEINNIVKEIINNNEYNPYTDKIISYLRSNKNSVDNFNQNIPDSVMNYWYTKKLITKEHPLGYGEDSPVEYRLTEKGEKVCNKLIDNTILNINDNKIKELNEAEERIYYESKDTKKYSEEEIINIVEEIINNHKDYVHRIISHARNESSLQDFDQYIPVHVVNYWHIKHLITQEQRHVQVNNFDSEEYTVYVLTEKGEKVCDKLISDPRINTDDIPF